MRLKFAPALLLGFAVVASPAQDVTSTSPCNTAPQTCATTISTRAVASRSIPNTAVDVGAGITATDKQLAVVQHQLAEQAATLLTWLRQQKVEQLITSAVNVSPQMESEKNGKMHIVGYTGTTSVAFRTTPEKAPQILTGVLANGGNSIDSTVFTATDEEVRAAQRELSAEAVRNAISQANAMAKAADMHVVAVKSINVGNEGAYNPHPVAFAGMVAGAVPAPPPIETAAGEQQITVGVDVVVAARP